MTLRHGGNGSSPGDATHIALLTVERFAAEERLFRRARKVMVAVSGGADSLALLVILGHVRERLGFEIVVAHFDHQLRADSGEDMAFVREVSARLGYECVTGEGDVGGVAAERRAGIEAVAREMRYQFLGFVAGKEGADRIATGHTADDQAETVLHRILRGSGVRGIRGMLPLAPVPGAEAQQLIRPLLCLGRAETETTCAEAGLVPRIDASNADAAHTRNRLRHEVLPYLRASHPGVRDSLLGLAESAREAFEPIERQARAVQPRTRGELGVVFDRAALRTLPAEALALVIEREASFFREAPEVNRTRLHNLEAVLGKGTGSVLFGRVEVEASCGQVRIGAPRAAPPRVDAVILSVPGTTRVGDTMVDVSTRELEAAPGQPVVTIDRERAKGVLRGRPLLPGDRMWRGGELRSVQKVLINAKVPRWERDGLVAVASGEAVAAVLGAPVGVNPVAAAEQRLYLRARRVV
ncbi:MAG TPA: tRNA lysidine(34) synthetase TilS [Longimicrobiales bacterium]|nr:tRNA lysidine(34) synthetase TilS [Longimicrobiales bacterium]